MDWWPSRNFELIESNFWPWHMQLLDWSRIQTLFCIRKYSKLNRPRISRIKISIHQYNVASCIWGASKFMGLPQFIHILLGFSPTVHHPAIGDPLIHWSHVGNPRPYAMLTRPQFWLTRGACLVTYGKLVLTGLTSNAKEVLMREPFSTLGRCSWKLEDSWECKNHMNTMTANLRT